MDKSWPYRTGGTVGCPQARLATRRFGCAPLSPSSRSVGPSRVSLDTVIEPSAPADGVRRVRLARIARHPWLLELTMVRPVLSPSVIARYDHELAAVDGVARTGIGAGRGGQHSCRPRRGRGLQSTRVRGGGAPDGLPRPGVVDGARANSRAVARPGDVSRGGRGAGRRRRGPNMRPHPRPSRPSSSVCSESSTGYSPSQRLMLRPVEGKSTQTLGRQHWTLFLSFEISPGVGGTNGGEPLLMRMLRSALLALVVALIFGALGAGTATAATVVIDSVDTPTTAFQPANVTIDTGDTVRWEFDAATSTHTVTSSSANWSIDQTRDPNGAPISRTFDTPGVYSFLCKVHTGMTGSVTVQAPSPEHARQGPCVLQDRGLPA